MREPFSHEVCSIIGHASSLRSPWTGAVTDLVLMLMRYWISLARLLVDRIFSWWLAGAHNGCWDVPLENSCDLFLTASASVSLPRPNSARFANS